MKQHKTAIILGPRSSGKTETIKLVQACLKQQFEVNLRC